MVVIVIGTKMEHNIFPTKASQL